MTAAVIESGRKSGSANARKMVKGTVSLLATFLPLIAFSVLFLWQYYYSQNENGLSREAILIYSYVLGGYVGGCVLWFLFFCNYQFAHEGAIKFIRRKTWVGPYSVIWLLLSVVPLAGIWSTVSKPYYLLTPDGHVRVMEDGRVFYPGSAVEGKRFSDTSAIIPLNLFSEGSYLGTFNPAPVFAQTPSGRIYLSLHANFDLHAGDGLTALLSSGDYELIEKNERRFFEGQVSAYLGKVSTTLVTELQAGKYIPSNTVRLTQLIDDDPNRPEWLGRIQVWGVKVGSGESS